MEQTIDAAEIKLAANEFPIHPLIRGRWSPRAFAARAVEPEKVRSLLEAARWAPSGGNGQPWHFIIGAKGTATHQRLIEAIKEGNLPWAGEAPLLMLTVAKTTTSSGRPHTHAFHDVGLAVATLTFQAAALDLFVHQMGGFYPERARALFAIPEGYDPVTMVAIGYLGDPATLDEKTRAREVTPRTRRPLVEFVFEEAWEKPAAVVQIERLRD